MSDDAKQLAAKLAKVLAESSATHDEQFFALVATMKALHAASIQQRG